MPDERFVYEFLETGVAVPFEIVKKDTEPGPDGVNVLVRVEMQLGGVEDHEPAEVVEWGAFGFIFALAVLSFADARPRGYSEMHYVRDDDFGIEDLMRGLSFRRGHLHFHADYVRGRCVKTTIIVTDDGRVSLSTWNRGEGALHWVERLKGKKLMEIVR